MECIESTLVIDPQYKETVNQFLLKHVFTEKRADKGVLDVTPSFKESDKWFGGCIGSEGDLAKHFPDVFGENIVKQAIPRASTSYGRFMVAMTLLGNQIYWYQREKHDYFENEAWGLAKDAGARYVLMENIS